MSQENQYLDCAMWQSGIIAAIVLYITWHWFDISNIVKLIIGLAIAASLFALFLILPFFHKRLVGTTALLLIVLLTIPIPAAINYLSKSQNSAYLTSYPTDEQIHFRVNYSVERIETAGSLGHDLSYSHYLNEKAFSSGDLFSYNVYTPLKFSTVIVEHDQIDDVGEGFTKTFRFSENHNYTHPFTVSTDTIRVKEKGGRNNAGSYSDFVVSYTLTRIIPEDTSFFSLYLLESPSETYHLRYSLLIAEAFIGVVCIFALVIGIPRRKSVIEALKLQQEQEDLERARQRQLAIVTAKREKEQRLAQEAAMQLRIKAEKAAKKEEEKATFILNLDGKTIRQAAGVPNNIRYLNGLPVDNNNSQFGSFTVYRSKSGNCYHEQSGCCSAHIPMHIFNAKPRYKPCSKCVREQKYKYAPYWHSKYMELTRKCKELGLNPDQLNAHHE